MRLILFLFMMILCLVSVNAYNDTWINETFYNITYINENFYLKNETYNKTQIDNLINPSEIETEVLKIGQCPSTSAGMRNLWIITIILLILGISFIIFNHQLFSIGIGLIMIILSLNFYDCGSILNYILILIGLSYMLIGLFQKPR